jgi:uncharacterized protein (DUF433 family)
MFDSVYMEVPLERDPDGRVRVKGTEIALEQIVAEFEDGAIPDEIVFRHQELALGDVFLVLAFYMRYRKDLEDYLADRQAARRPKQKLRPKPAA